jgi:hypothetical protein
MAARDIDVGAIPSSNINPVFQGLMVKSAFPVEVVFLDVAVGLY